MPGLDAAMRGGMPERGDCAGEVGEADSSEEESESDSARPRRALMGMGLLCRTLLSELAAMLLLFVTTTRAKESEHGERGGRRGGLDGRGSGCCI